ncbi:hypothetical protein [Rhizobium sp. MHM7A]|uniref:hypothetical protein n=1 Tax=Rhizobium sp. MHM7A TaxID=2583233 RepID=UPI001106A61C|nr:hypothetical protein [Rhizobium sp. MHM7A]TLX16760.1 hypothetical protein FFR93_05295 [Rhizobium sp. MHM7A]
METTKTTLESLISFAKYRDINDAEQVSKVADHIGPMDRDAYLATIASWKSEYKALSQKQRDLKPQRKGGTPEASTAITNHRTGRDNARAYMLLRAALKLVARRHFEECKKAA